MIDMIKRDAHLVPYLKENIEDNGISAIVDDKLTTDEYVAIKVDEYYAGLREKITPKSVDFVVVVDCQCNSYVMYILEFKNVHKSRGLNIAEIQEKFANTIDDFLSNTFSSIFENDRFKYKDIKLFLVSDAYQQATNNQTHAEVLAFREKINKKDSLKVDLRLRQKLFKFRGRVLQIEYDIPPNPIIARQT